jgi:hypothetical protein
VASKGLGMANPRAGGHRHIPQLIPQRLLRSDHVHHKAALEEAKRRSDSIQPGWPTASQRSRAR